MYAEMEMERIAPSPAPSSPPGSSNFELANRVMFFVPGEDKALIIYDQSPEGPEAEFAGSLPEGQFHASGMFVEERDPNKIEEEYTTIRYRDGSCMQRAIPVDEETFLRIAIQGIYPQYAQAEHRRDYMVINIHNQTRELRRETIQAILDDEKGTLNQNQQNILAAAVDVSGDSMRRIILGENNKSFQ